MAYRLIINKNINKIIAKLDVKISKKIISAIKGLSSNPRPIGYIKLTGEKNSYRIRVGDYRIVYEIYDSKVLIIIINIGHRKYVYKEK